MTKTSTLHVPIFIVNLKSYVWGRKALKLSRIVEKVAQKTNVYVCIVPQLVDIYTISKEVNVPVFAPHMDSLVPGRGTGRVLAEAIKEAGAVGALLSHTENKLSLSEISRTINRTRKAGLISMVCCNTPKEAQATAMLGPDVIISEPSSRIGTLKSVGKDYEFVTKSIRMVKNIDPKIIVICGAGVSSGNDVAELVKLGVDGTGASRVICEAENPFDLLKDMIKALETE
jgi:triosephosphate isomerase